MKVFDYYKVTYTNECEICTKAEEKVEIVRKPDVMTFGAFAMKNSNSINLFEWATVIEYNDEDYLYLGSTTDCDSQTYHNFAKLQNLKKEYGVYFLNSQTQIDLILCRKG